MERAGAVIVGGGAVGCAVAWQLAGAGVGDLVLCERRPTLGDEQSGRSSGVIHAGIYYAEGTLKARLCVEANRGMYAFCEEHGVPCANTGKLVVAPDEAGLPALASLHARAAANGVPGIQMLSRREVKALEPNIEVPAALLVPSTGIVDAARLVRTLARLAQARGASILTGFEVTSIKPRGDLFEITGRHGEDGETETFEADLLVNAAGLECDVVGRMVDPALDVNVVPLRGEYFRMNRRHRPGLWLSGRNIYPVPELLRIGTGEMTIVGVHLTPTFELDADGNTVLGDCFTVGPEFKAVPSRYDYESDRFEAQRFVSRAGRFLPALTSLDLSMDYTGIMVHIPGRKDWEVRRDARYPGCVHMLGIDSPGLTCSLELGKRVRELLLG